MESLLELTHSPLTLVTEHRRASSQFFVCEVLKEAVSSNSGLGLRAILVCLEQPFTYYARVLRRSGVDLPRSVRRDHTLAVVDGVSLWDVGSGETGERELQKPGNVRRLDHQGDGVSERLAELVEDLLLSSDGGRGIVGASPVVIIDGAHTLQLLDDDTAVLSFIQRLRRFCVICRGSCVDAKGSHPSLRLALRVNNDAAFLNEGDDSCAGRNLAPLCSRLAHLAGALVEVRELSSGHSKDVDGQVFATRYSATHYLPEERRAFLFKLAESSVELTPTPLE